jgi:TonB family protein
VYRDLSFSLAAHAALIATLLAFSATRQPVRLPEVVRPVRLLTSLELPRQVTAPAPVARTAEPAAALPAERSPRPLAKPAPPRAAPAAPAPVKPVAPVAIPRIVIPTTVPAAAPRTASRRAATRPAERTDTALRDRLTRRLSAPPDEKHLPEEAAAPRIASLPRPEAPAVPSHSAPVSATSATASVPAGPVQPVGFFPHAWYLAVLKERIFARWAPPSEFYVGAGSVAALVSFRIDRAGRVSRVAVKESSGHARFDRSALAAIQGLAQLPVLPEQYDEENLDVVIRFQNE